MKKEKAIRILKKKWNVVPEKYTMYNGGYLFLAYPPGMSKEDKERSLSGWYLVDNITGKSGPVSLAFDLDGFFKAIENLKDIEA